MPKSASSLVTKGPPSERFHARTRPNGRAEDGNQPKTRAVFVVPLSGARAAGPVAVWLLAAGWAAAARRTMGDACVITPEGQFTPEDVRTFASRAELAASQAESWRSFVPQQLRTLFKDLRQVGYAWSLQRRVHLFADQHARAEFVWQHHQLFHRLGYKLARRLGCPLVLHVDAPIVWESNRWGVRRPGWGWLLEMFIELHQFHLADLITCPSDEVAQELLRRGISPERIAITPGGVDVDAFSPQITGDAVRDRYNLWDKFVVGWTGSFRRFHGVELAIEAIAQLQARLPNISLMLVGDGFDRARLEQLANQKGAKNVVFTGTVPHTEMPSHVAAMNVTMVLADPVQGFHYSPMKLREYMAAGKPVVACRVGELARLLNHDEDALLITPGDADELARAIARLYASKELRTRLGSAARATMVKKGSWDVQVERVRALLRTGAGKRHDVGAEAVRRTPSLKRFATNEAATR